MVPQLIVVLRQFYWAGEEGSEFRLQAGKTSPTRVNAELQTSFPTLTVERSFLLEYLR
jgi:hypothetical protein